MEKKYNKIMAHHLSKWYQNKIYEIWHYSIESLELLELLIWLK